MDYQAIKSGGLVALISALVINWFATRREKTKEARTQKEFKKRIRQSILPELKHNFNLFKELSGNLTGTFRGTHAQVNSLFSRLETMYINGNFADLEDQLLGEKLTRLYFYFKTYVNPTSARWVQLKQVKDELDECIKELEK